MIAVVPLAILAMVCFPGSAAVILPLAGLGALVSLLRVGKSGRNSEAARMAQDRATGIALLVPVIGALAWVVFDTGSRLGLW